MHRLYQYISREESKAYVEKVFVYSAFALFLLHLFIIFLANETEYLPRLFRNVHPNYLSALYTPFSVILVYEVYFMILSIPLSFTESIKKQYEIISLIIIRRVFKDISDFESFDAILQNSQDFLQIIADLGAGLVLFALVAVFYHISKNRKPTSKSDKLQNFIRFKEIVTIALAALLFVLAIYAFGEWLREVYLSAYTEKVYSLELHTIFFDDLFSVMIFADVLIFIASFLYTKRYEVLFRNAGYVASTILIRISLTLDTIYGPIIAIGAVLTGIIVQVVFRYFSWLDIEEDQRIYPSQ
ncbi:hypothetical protein G3570_06050 [Balneolaceae bacterium YR4-1]|uniref:Uncharacterized protein n=1 Tax=Halalkalibaculum roseum TaxID=2709311 RepID=A0A6M1T2C9_9BACT|nr:hypothetical protein [Halalkalibaculum roseum]NGP76185.1 hypothetical protein [Halalkalibaculum roseum]